LRLQLKLLTGSQITVSAQKRVEKFTSR